MIGPIQDVLYKNLRLNFQVLDMSMWYSLMSLAFLLCILLISYFVSSI